MNPLRRLFQRKPGPPVESVQRPRPSAQTGGGDGQLITGFDKYGREIHITKENWRTSVLPGSLKAAWNAPDDLYGVIVQSLHDGFRADIVPAAQHLYRIDRDRVRAACLWGIVLLEEGRLDEAEQVLVGCLQEAGENGYVLTNLAKVHDRRGADALAEQTLWRALRADPNQENGLGWYAALHRERDGEPAAQAALRRVAALPGSWRAQLWLAQDALKADDLRHAITLYQVSLANAGQPVPTDLLMQMTGDLGNRGHLRDLLMLTEPVFDAAVHGLSVGNNLIKAYVERGQLDDARGVLDRLYAQQRPDWQEALNFWDAQIAKARIDAQPGPEHPVELTMLQMEGPIWLPDPAEAAEVFPPKPRDELVVCFLGSSATGPQPGIEMQRQFSEGVGRMTRALPLFLAEQAYFGTRARVRVLVPWIAAGGGSFVLAGERWTDARATELALAAAPGAACVVTVHLVADGTPWRAEIRLLRPSDGTCVDTLSTEFLVNQFGDELPRLAGRLLDGLERHADIGRRTPPDGYYIPGQLGPYLLRLEQLLAVRCAGADGAEHGFLSGVREIIDGQIHLCAACPGSVATRLVLAQTLLYLRRVEPAVLGEFAGKIRMLQRDEPLPGPSQRLIQRLLDRALAPTR